MKIRILKFIGILLLVIAVFVVIYAIYNLNYDYSGEKFRRNKASSLGLEDKEWSGYSIIAWTNGRLEGLSYCIS